MNPYERIANALYSLIFIPSLRQWEMPASKFVNLEWMTRINEILFDHTVGFDTVMEYIDYVENNLRQILIDQWHIWEQVENVQNFVQCEFEYTYHHSYGNLAHGLVISFTLRRNNGDLELMEIHDQLNPHHDYGFIFPFNIGHL